ncbi:aminopeptidase [bacterium SCSIO 12741]|nr:aminopeptidase [bacterium SCSIO 12741]
MKKFQYLLLSGLVLLSYCGHSQDERRNKEEGGFIFSDIKEQEATEVKNQYRSGTCWSFGGSSFLESELIRMGKDPVNLSEMFIVRHAYSMKAEEYVRMHGYFQFGPGGQFHDLIRIIEKNGLVPESAYGGQPIYYGKPVHEEMDAMAKAMVEVVVKNPNKRLSDHWRSAYEGMLDSYLGEFPEEFEFKGQSYTPQSYAESLGVNWGDYVEITSFSHQPFYESFVLKIPDNWMLESYYNLPLDDLMEVMKNAVDQGYTVAWDADVSERTFSFKNGVAFMPDVEYGQMSRERRDTLFNAPGPELEVTQENRQKMYDNYLTTDDHLMHITGSCKDQNGTGYFIVKNSWGDDRNDCGGYLYASEAYFKAKTVAILIHKDAIPAKIKKKLGL